MMSFCMAMAAGCHNLSGNIEFVDKLWDCLYFIVFLPTGLCSQRYACVERVSRHDIRISPVRQNCAPLGLAVNTDYLPPRTACNWA